MNLTQITDTYEHSHMPWVAHNYKGHSIFVFCLRLNDVWKVHYAFEDGVVHRLYTGLPESAYECNPVASYKYEEQAWYISFVGGNCIGHPRLHIYQVRIDNTSTDIQPIKTDVITGYFMDEKTAGYIRYGNIMCHGHIDNPRVYKLNRAQRTFCMRPYEVGNIIVSYFVPSQDIQIETLLINPTAKTAYELFDADTGDSMYKACYHSGSWFYALRTGDNMEERKIVRAKHPVLTPVDFDTYIEIGDHVSDLDKRTLNRRSLDLILFDLPKELR